MAKKVKLADVLWDAARNALWDGDEHGVCSFSCDAVRYACGRTKVESLSAERFLKRLGCPVRSLIAFSDFKDLLQRQGVRYMWLLLAMKVAEDENIEIEVA